ncbi:hypothetical protein B0A52_03236 [Exophiala mesophila]|uniref:Metallo-beta-lactamase domain-containing protein n=1 Tax=Exophiala mesophila TaxID=212818 RepID=A0A438NAU1_EXOME|nr:hypothetical protein B0A52_03236 [Exophiala mesophila]
MAVYHSPPASALTPSFADVQDFVDADRGLIASLKPCVIKNANGKVVWNNDEFDFMHKSPCPSTVDPKLWRQGQLLSKQGLYRVTDSIHQIRGFDISHMTVVEGRSGVIVIDPLISCECAAAALKFYQQHRGVRPIKALIYTHSHVDHYGGAAGLFPDLKNDAAPDGVPVIAPEGFMEEALSENILAGPIMRRRAAHMYGAQLPRCAAGSVGVGLGMGTSSGRVSLIPPTTIISHTSQQISIDGVAIVFQMVPNTEAPSEMNMYFPQERALLIAECAGHSLHNIITPRGALVRDAKAWARYLDESLTLFCDAAGSDVLLSSHGWPTWGAANVKKYIAEQRDLYGYCHDQTVRLMNCGLNGAEIAETFVLPPNLRRAWHAQGFYGSVSHNVKGIYQRYMTWYDGRAENLWKWPPKEEGSRYVQAFGGPQETLRKAKQFFADGDLRFAATILSHLVASQEEYTQPIQEESREALAQVFERLGLGSENALWRNIYLCQSRDLKQGPRRMVQGSPLQAGLPPQLSIQDSFSALSVSINGEDACRHNGTIHIGIQLEDLNQAWALILSNGVLTSRQYGNLKTLEAIPQDCVITLNVSQLRDLLTGKADFESLSVLSGRPAMLAKILSFAGIEMKNGPPASHL